MNIAKNSVTMLLIAGSLMISVFIVSTVLVDGGNQIGQTFKYLTAIGALIALTQPRFGFWVVIISMGYLDLVKRFLVLGTYLSIYDVALVLAFSPVLCTAATVGQMLRDNFRGGSSSNNNFKLTVVTCVLGMALALLGVIDGGVGIGGAKQVANYAGYVGMIYLIPRLFPEKEDLLRMVKKVIWLFIPVAIYAFYQYLFGFHDFEIEYLKSGLSVEKRILTGQDYRFFSTLNSSQNLSKVMGIMLVISLVYPWKRGSFITTSIIALILVCLFGGAAFVSGARTGWVQAAAGLVLLILVRKRPIFLAFAGVSCVSFVVLVFNARSIADAGLLNDASHMMMDEVNSRDTRDSAIVNLATFNDRLASLDSLTNTDFWTPFGFPIMGKDAKEEGFFIHDIVSDLLARVGFIPLIIVAALAFVTLYRQIGRRSQNVAIDRIRWLAISLILMILVGGISDPTNIKTFPVTTMLYMAAGTVATMNRLNNRLQLENNIVAEEIDATEADKVVALYS